MKQDHFIQCVSIGDVKSPQHTCVRYEYGQYCPDVKFFVFNWAVVQKLQYCNNEYEEAYPFKPSVNGELKSKFDSD